MNIIKTEKFKGYLQLILVILFVVFAFAFSAMLKSKKSDFSLQKNQTKDLYVKIANVKAQDKRLELDLTGVFKARSEVEIIPQVSGRVVNVSDNFYSGSTFSPDEVVFEIEDEDYQLEVKRLEAEVKKAQTAYDLEEVESKAAKLEWYQVHDDNSKVPDLVLRKPQLSEAKANLEAAQSVLQNAKLDLKRTKYSLPFWGRILQSSIAKGQYLNAGQSYGRLYSIFDMEIESAIGDKQAAILAQSGAQIDVKISTNYLGQSYQYDGILKRAFSEYESNTRLGRIVFAIKGQCNIKLFPGIFAKIKILGKKVKDVLVLPISAIQNGNKIWMVDEKNRLKPLKGEILYSDDEKIYFKSDLKSVRVVFGKIAGAFEDMPVVVIDEGLNAKK